MILGSIFIYKFIKSIEPKCRRIGSEIGRSVSVLASFTDVTTAHVGLDGPDKDKEEVICEVAKRTTVQSNLDAILKMITNSAGTFIVKARRELTVRTCLRVALRILEVFPSKPSQVVMTNLTKNGHPAKTFQAEKSDGTSYCN